MGSGKKRTSDGGQHDRARVRGELERRLLVRETPAPPAVEVPLLLSLVLLYACFSSLWCPEAYWAGRKRFAGGVGEVVEFRGSSVHLQ